MGVDGILYWGKPGSLTGDRSNYTLHHSWDGGASWEFVDRVYPGGAGYSDAVVASDGKGGQMLVMAFQKTFDPPVPGIEGGGYDIGVARFSLGTNSMIV